MYLQSQEIKEQKIILQEGLDSMSLRANYYDSIDFLKLQVAQMFDKVSLIVEFSQKALLEKDIVLAKKIIEMDLKVDNLMDEIEEKAIELIALQQPLAGDLRVIFSISKIITDLERIADFGVNVSKEVIKIGQEDSIIDISKIVQIYSTILEMIQYTKQAFIKEDVVLAQKVAKEDELVDNLYKDLYNLILIKINKDSSNIVQGTKFLFIGRYLERMADHTTNICERIVFIVKGEKVDLN